MKQPPIKVLIADDQRFFLEVIKCCLKSKDMKIVGSAIDGEEVLSAVRSLTPDVLILDLEMPKINGYQLIEKLSSYTSLKIIVFSAHQEKSYVTRAIKAGVHGYLSKLKLNEGDELESTIRLVYQGYCAFNYKFLTQTLSVMNLANSKAAVNSQVRSKSRVRATKPKKRPSIDLNPLLKFAQKQTKKSVSSKLDYLQQLTVKFSNFARNFQFSIKLKFVHFILFFCCTLSLTIFVSTIVIALD
ncbi:response regulator transcription factor [Myxosarcina sp. GI1]|uniref:response regulator n=1 Tax=Myxosarcina sp. GI1 TaxID=1541065 RepID=UPI0006902E44|nr:response regulator transcription factor [Myxosarcina sp. GI1]